MKNKSLIIVSILLLTIARTTLAWDGNRKGFIVGLGAGYGNHWLIYEAYNTDETGRGYEIVETDSKSGLMSDFKIGFAPSNRFAIFWTSKVAWLYLSEDEYAVASGVAGLGVACFDEPQAPCMYYTGGIGYSALSMPFSGDTESASGFGMSLGAGYEFARHLNVECNLTYGNLRNLNWGLDAKAVAVRVTVNVLGY